MSFRSSRPSRVGWAFRGGRVIDSFIAHSQSLGSTRRRRPRAGGPAPRNGRRDDHAKGAGRHNPITREYRHNPPPEFLRRVTNLGISGFSPPRRVAPGGIATTSETKADAVVARRTRSVL